MEKKKIAVIIRGFHNGGIERVLEEYYSHMDLSQFDIHVMTNMKNMPEKTAIFENMGCTIHALSTMRGHRFSLKNVREYKRIFKEGKYDVVHNNVPDNLLPLHFSKKYGVPVRILHAHNLYTEDFHKKKKIVAALYKLGFKINTSKANCLIGVSRLAAEAAFAKKSLEAIVLKNAITIDKFAFSMDNRRTIRASLGLLDDQLLFGHVGRYENNQKNQEFVLHLYQKIVEKYPTSRLVMIGEGKRRQEFMDMADQLGISSNVFFLGAISNVNEYLSAMDIFLLPSRKEGLTVAGVEAQTSGVKCIFSNMIPEETYISDDLVVNDIAGDDAIDTWFASVEKIVAERPRDENHRMEAKAQTKKAGFDIADQAEELTKIYNS